MFATTQNASNIDKSKYKSLLTKPYLIKTAFPLSKQFVTSVHAKNTKKNNTIYNYNIWLLNTKYSSFLIKCPYAKILFSPKIAKTPFHNPRKIMTGISENITP